MARLCTVCGLQLPGDAKFCPHCGTDDLAKLQVLPYCTSCGIEMQDKANFCHYCGRRQVTLLSPSPSPSAMACLLLLYFTGLQTAFVPVSHVSSAVRISFTCSRGRA